MNSFLMRITSVGLLAAMLGVASRAAAKGWEPPSYGLNMSAFGTSEAFPGSVGSGPDRGFDPVGSLSSALRLSPMTKLGVGLTGGLHVQQQFTRANYGWIGVNSNLRRNRTTLTMEAQYTPRRNKFPTDPEEGGPYTGYELTLGGRQNVGQRARVRLEGTVDREDFFPPFSLRDGVGRELYGQTVFTPLKGIDLRVEGSFSHDQTVSRKYVKDTHWLGGGGVWSDSLWRLDLSARSGVRRYTDSILGDSNFQRRDQWIELRLRGGRALRPGLAANAGLTFENQTSSRVDRNYSAGTFTLGLEWTGGGK